MTIWLILRNGAASAVLALLNRQDALHTAARRTYDGLAREGAALFLTNFLIAEAYALIGSRADWERARRWLADLSWGEERVTERDERRARAILLHQRDKSCSYVDATSFAVMERVEVKDAFTFDRHFTQYGFRALGL